MNRESLRRLADSGLAALPPDGLVDLAAWCRDWCEATGDGRYGIVGETLDVLSRWFEEHDKYGGVPTELVGELDALLERELPSILDAEDPSSAAILSRGLREAVQDVRARW